MVPVTSHTAKGNLQLDDVPILVCRYIMLEVDAGNVKSRTVSTRMPNRDQDRTPENLQGFGPTEIL